MRFLFLYIVTGIFVFLSITLTFPFIVTDDPGYITENPFVIQPHFLRILSPSTFTLNDWIPAVTFYHAAQYYVFGFTPVAFRLCHIIIYIFSIAAARRFLKTAGFSNAVTLSALTIYAFHPLNAEIMGWLSSTKNILSFLFGFLFLDFFLKRKYLLGFLMLFFAFMSKGTAVSFPIIAALIYASNRTTRGKDTIIEILWLCIFLLAGLIRSVISMTGQMEVIYQRSSSLLDFTERMSISGRVALRQLRQFLIPYDLSLMYGWRELPFSDFKVWGSWVFLGVLLAFYLFIFRKSREMLIALAIILGGALPIMNFSPSPLFQADRYYQITLFGLSLAVSYLIFNRGMYFRYAAGAWFLLLLLPLSYLQLLTWRDSEAVWTTMVKKHPRYPYARVVLGQELYRQGRFKEAEESIKTAIALDSSYSHAQNVYKELFSKPST